MGTKVFPSVNDLHGGKALTESNLLFPGTQFGEFNHVGAGMGLSTYDDVSVTVGGGVAIVGGRKVTLDGYLPPNFGDLPTNATRYVHLTTVIDASGNISEVNFTLDASPMWMASINPTRYHLCLGCVKTGPTGNITELTSATHFPKHGRGHIARIALGSHETVAVPSQNVNYATPLVLPRIVAPRDCRLEFTGVMTVRTGAEYYPTKIHARLVDDADRSTIRWSVAGTLVESQAGYDDAVLALPLTGTIVLSAGQVFTPRIMVRASRSGTVTLDGGYADFTAWLTDRY